MDHIRTNNLREAFYAMNNFFTHLTNGDSQAVTHNVFRNDHFLNAYNIFLEADSHENGLTLEQMGYSKAKMTHLIKSYLSKEALEDWIKRIQTKLEDLGVIDSDIVMRTTDSSKHSNGPCILAFSFRWRENGIPHLIVTSRSAELPQIFGGDTIFISAIAELIRRRIGFSPQVKVTWFISSARIKSRAANFYRLMIHPMKPVYLNRDFQRHVEKQWSNILADQEKTVSFSKLVKLQKEYKRVVIDKESPVEQTGVEHFIQKLEKGW